MLRSGAIGILAALLFAPAASGQEPGERKDAIGLRVRVIDGLGAAGAAQMARLVPQALAQGSLTGRFELADLDALLASLAGSVPQQPGVMVSMVVLGPEGVVVHGGTGGSGFPEWFLGPSIADGPAADAALRAFGDVLRRSEGEYYLYVSVSACSV